MNTTRDALTTMGAAKKLIDKKVLRDLIPINALSANHIEEISKKAFIEDVRSGTYVFKQGDRDYQTVYLLDGKVELLDADREVVGSITAGTEASRHPLAHKQPRQLGARAAGKVTVARVDSSLLDVLLTWDESAGYDVVEIDAQDDDDWMTRMLQSQAFLQLPPSNIHQLLMRLEAVSAKAGDVIVRQGDEGDYFYIVKSGRLAVTRKASSRSREVLLAELGEGACFGEEALVSGTNRNASVMMVTNGSLMRLSKQDFQELLCTSLVHEIDFEAAQKLAESGAKWLDVRLPGEYENQAIKDSINLPLSALRDQCAELGRDCDYIVCCDTGRRSAAGAFVLSQRGFTVYTLKKGLMQAPASLLTGNAPGDSGDPAQDAEIIPFESDNRSEAVASARQNADEAPVSAADTVLIDKLAAAENDKLALEEKIAELQSQYEDASRRADTARQENQSVEHLQQELDALKSQSEQREQHMVAIEEDKHALQAEAAVLRDETTASRQKLQEADGEKHALQAELKRLQASIAQIQESADGKDDALHHELEQMTARLASEQERYEKQLQDLGEELDRVRDDYHQLGQRTSALAGERDASVTELDTLKARLNTGESEKQHEIDRLQQALTEREAAIGAEKEHVASLGRQLEAAENSRRDLERQLDDAGQAANAGQSRVSSLEERLKVIEQQNLDLETALSDAQQQLTVLQDQSQQKLVDATEEQQAVQQRADDLQRQLDRSRDESDAENTRLQKTIEQLQQESQAVGQERDGLEQEKQQLAERLAEYEQSRQQAESLSQEEISAKDEHIKALEGQLQQVQQERSDLEQRANDLDERLKSDSKEYESDLSSAREALGRAQTETENIKREQSRLMESMRKTERTLERERQDHESEVHRLHRELKDAAGESNAGLAAELEASQEKIKEQTRERDELDIKLGERSAQLEDTQAEVEKLSLQLHQAQASAQQAEQQLLEANQAANEEMAVRMEAEEKAQQALRDELAGALSARNRSQEQLTVQQQELDELRAALEASQQQASSQGEASQAAFSAVERERDTALEEQIRLQQEIDQLRAEAEVTRGLVDMQASPGAVDAALREELEQAKKNVDVAVRLRNQAEEKNAELQAEIETLRDGLQSAQRHPEGHIPSLDENDPHASSVLNPDYPDDHTDSVPTAAVLLEEDEVQVRAAAGTPAAPAERAGGSGLKGILAGVIIGAIVAGAAVWWLSAPQTELPTVDSVIPLTGKRAETGTGLPLTGGQSEPDTPGTKDKPAKQTLEPNSVETAARRDRQPSEVPANAPNFAKGGSAKPSAITPPPTRTEPQREGAGEAGSKTAGAESQPEQGQAFSREALKTSSKPARSFSDSLSSGGRAPVMVELYADSYYMGSGVSSPNFDERPRHRVKLKSFSISRHEVTFDDYDRFARATGRRLPSDAGWGRGQRPVVNVRWQDALAYTQWLSEQTGVKYRLPTEAEWEYAVRAGTQSRFWWGAEVGEAQANCFDCGSRWAGLKTAPVGSFKANPFGLHDMSGNAMEWTQDCYQADYTNAPSDGSAVTGGACDRRVVRGGGYGSPSESLRSASRDAREADTRLDNLGFRVVRE